MEIEIKDAMDFVGYCHLYHQQYIIDQQIDHAEYVNRLGWIDYASNSVKYADEIAANEDLNTIFQLARAVLENPPQK